MTEGPGLRVISEHALSRAILTSEAFGTYSMAEPYRRLQEHLAHDFTPTIELCDMLPTFIDGASHHRNRRLIAERLSEHKQRQIEAATDFLDRFAGDALVPGKTLDLLSEFAEPLFLGMARATLAGGISAGAAALAWEVPTLFSSTAPLKTRIEIDRRLRDLFDRGEIDRHDFAALVLGAKPLTGSLALSLHAVFSDHPGRSLSAMEWPQTLPRSALQYVDRIALQPAAIGEETFSAGERVRCLIQADGWTDEERRSTMFGSGAHLCLGRPLSELLWRMTAGRFAQCDLTVATRPVTIRKDSEPFHLPERCEVRFEP